MKFAAGILIACVAVKATTSHPEEPSGVEDAIVAMGAAFKSNTETVAPLKSILGAGCPGMVTASTVATCFLPQEGCLDPEAYEVSSGRGPWFMVREPLQITVYECDPSELRTANSITSQTVIGHSNLSQGRTSFAYQKSNNIADPLNFLKVGIVNADSEFGVVPLKPNTTSVKKIAFNLDTNPGPSWALVGTIFSDSLDALSILPTRSQGGNTFQSNGPFAVDSELAAVSINAGLLVFDASDKAPLTTPQSAGQLCEGPYAGLSVLLVTSTSDLSTITVPLTIYVPVDCITKKVDSIRFASAQYLIVRSGRRLSVVDLSGITLGDFAIPQNASAPTPIIPKVVYTGQFDCDSVLDIPADLLQGAYNEFGGVHVGALFTEAGSLFDLKPSPAARCCPPLAYTEAPEADIPIISDRCWAKTNLTAVADKTDSPLTISFYVNQLVPCERGVEFSFLKRAFAYA